MALAGVYVNAFLGVAFLLLAFVLTLLGRVVLPFYYFALSNLVVSVYNLIPLVKLDGYWFLSAVLQVNNLMDKGFLMAYATFFHRNTLPELRMPAGQRAAAGRVRGGGAVVQAPVLGIQPVRHQHPPAGRGLGEMGAAVRGRGYHGV